MNLSAIAENITEYRVAEWVEMTGLPAQTYWDLFNAALALLGSYAGSALISLSSTL